MDQQDTIEQISDATETERDAARLLLALDACVLTDDGECRAIERYATRVRFALDRVTELRRTDTLSLKPATLRFALSILDNHLQQSAIFAHRVASRLPKQPAPRYDLVLAEEPEERDQPSSDRAA